jgi:type III pantothenate kinase
MLLTADLGNSSLKIGLHLGTKLVRRLVVPTNSKRLMKEGLVKATSGRASEAAMLCSVVPGLTDWLAKQLAKLIGRRPLRLSHKSDLGLKLKIGSPDKLGADRLANAVAASRLYRLPCLVVDFGTVTNYDVVSSSREYLGGVLAPGFFSSAESMSEKAAQLPKARLVCPRRAIGRNTAEAMTAGLVIGQLGQLSRIVSEIGNELGEKPTVVATGGGSHLLDKLGAGFDHLDRDLTLRGLQIAYEINRPKQEISGG